MYNLKPPLWTIVLSGKGGVGKSLFSLAYLDLCELNGVAVDIMQLDDQSRLERAVKRPVVSLDMRTAKRARQDPTALTKTFSPLYKSLESMNTTARSLHLDVGATQQLPLFDYAALVALDEDLREFGITGIAFVVATSDPQSIEQAARSLDGLSTVLPSLQPILVLNERDGSFDQLPIASDALRIYTDLLEPKLAMVPTVRMPLITAGSWQWFERKSLRLLEVVAMDTPSVIAATGLSRPEAKLARGDVQAAFDVLEEGLAVHLPFFRAGESV